MLTDGLKEQEGRVSTAAARGIAWRDEARSIGDDARGSFVILRDTASCRRGRAHGQPACTAAERPSTRGECEAVTPVSVRACTRHEVQESVSPRGCQRCAVQ